MSTSTRLGPLCAIDFADGRAECIGALHLPERDAGERGKLSQIGALQIGEEAAALRGRVLDALDHAVAAVVHHDDADVELLLHRGPQLADIEEEAAVAGHHHGLASICRGGRAEAERQPLADAGADREHALMRAVHREDAVAPGGVALRHVAHPDRVLRHHRAQLLGETAIDAERGEEVRARGLLQRGEVACGRRDRSSAPFDARQQRLQRRLRIAADEIRVGIGAAVGKRIGVDLDQVRRQLHDEVAGLLAAQARADGEHQIDGLIELLDLRHAVAVQAAEAHRMLFRDDALAVDAVDHGEAEIEQLVHGRARAARAGTQPQHRTLRRNDARGKFVEFGIRRRARRRQRQHEVVEDGGTFDRRALQVDRHLHADRTGRRRQRIHRGAGQHADRLLRRADAIGALGHRAQHAELIRRVVHRAHLAVDEFRRCLAGDVQHGASRRSAPRSARRSHSPHPGPVDEKITPSPPETRA